MTDFIKTYVPALVELTPEELTDCRDRLERYCRVSWPDLDTSPNTILGDLILTPQAATIAALERGLDRFMSDLDLGNVAKDIIYNCDFVAAYIQNFVQYPTAMLQASGVVRLVFTKDMAYTLDRGTKLSFNELLFSIYLPNLGAFHIYPVGSSVPADTNGTVLKDSGSQVFYADIPVVGHSGESVVTAGTGGLISEVIPELGAITALIDFNPGSSEVSLPTLAQASRSTIYAASLNTRNGAIQYVRSTCPFVESVYVIRSGDFEMQREFANPFGAAQGFMDIYVRSKNYAFVETQSLKLYLSDDTLTFEGAFPYVGQPYYIEAVNAANALTEESVPYTITAVDTSDSLGLLASYTKHEQLTLTVTNQLVEGTSLYDVRIDDTGRKYAWFVVRYRTDPLLPTIAANIENPDYRPVNTNMLVRGFIPIVIRKFEVVYVRQPGVVPLLTEAKQSIMQYFDTLGAPDVYSDGQIASIMNIAGVKYVKDINVVANIQWSIAMQYKQSDDTLVPVPKADDILNSDALRVSYTNAAAGSCSIRNLRYYLLEGAVGFREVREI